MARKAKSEGNGEGKADQQFIPGTEPPRIKELDDSAELYKEGRDERMAATEEEVRLKKELIELMHKHKLTQYDIPGSDPPEEIVLTIVEEGVKVRKKKSVVREQSSEPPQQSPDEDDDDAKLTDEERAEVNEASDAVAAARSRLTGASHTQQP